MALSERIIFQLYRRGKRGDVVAGSAADKAMTGGVAIGADIVRMVVDAELGDHGEPEYLAVMGTFQISFESHFTRKVREP